MNAYTTDPEEIVSALMHADSDNVLLVGDSCAALAQIIVTLTRRVEAMYEVSCNRLAILGDENRMLRADVEALKIRLDDLEDTTETIEQEIGLAAYENGEDHL